MNKFLINLLVTGFVAVAVAGCANSARYALDSEFDSSPVKTTTKMTEALQCLGGVLERSRQNPGAYVFMVRDVRDGTVNPNFADGPLADAGRIQMISILTAHTKPSYSLVTDRFPLIFEQTSSERIGINRFGVPTTENLNTYVSMLTNFTNANRQTKGMPAVKSVMPLIINGAFTRYDSSHIRSRGYGENAGYRGDAEDEQSASIDLGQSGSERQITLVVNIIDPKTNINVGTQDFDLKFYSNSKTARFRVAVGDYYYGFSNTDVQVETVHAAQQILLEAGAIWILDNAFGSMVDFTPCFDTDEKRALGQDARYQRPKALPTAVAAQQLAEPPNVLPDATASEALAASLTEQLAKEDPIAQSLTAPAATPKTALEAVQGTTPETALEAVPGATPETAQEAVPGATPETTQVAALDTPTPAGQYQVKLSPQMRESLSKIASYDFVYGDASQWPRLYVANREQFRDKTNPDLIYPGQLINIPSIDDTKARAARRAGNTHWKVVVGTFAKSNNVVGVAEQLNSAGFDANYKLVTSGAGKATQIWLGPFAEKAEAKQISAQMKRITGEKGHVNKYRNE